MTRSETAVVCLANPGAHAGASECSGVHSSHTEGGVAEIVFYQIPISHFCEKVGWALDYKGLPYRSVCVNPLTRKELATVSQRKQVPVIRDGDHVVCDSSEIVQYLDDAYPERLLVPPKEPERGECLEIERIADEELGPRVRRVAYVALFADRSQFARVMLPKRGLTRMWNPVRRRVIPLLVKRHFGINPKRLAADKRHLAELLGELTGRLAGRRHFVGESLTIADIAVASLLNPLELVKDLSTSAEHSAIFDWMRGIRQEYGRRGWRP